ncbi:MAG TPA: polysaccharide deacetylase family protein [Anaerolineaceae bacterium]
MFYASHAMRVTRAAVLVLLIMGVVGLLGQRYTRPRTIVSITFDDGYADQWAGQSILRLHGMRGTFYIISGRVGQPGYMTWEQLTALRDQGSEVGGHTITHPNLKTLQGYALRHEICDGRVALMSHGFSVTSFAYTYGNFDRTTEQVVAECGFNSGRSVNGRLESIPPAQPYNLRAWDAVQTTTTLTDLRGYVKQAERAGGGWVDLIFHHVCTGCDPYSITPKDFSAFLDWLRQREPDGTVVRTVGEVMGGEVQPAIGAKK